MKIVDNLENECNYEIYKNNWMNIQTIAQWYRDNVNIPLTNDFIKYIINIGVIKTVGKIYYDDNTTDELYNITEINQFMLEYNGNDLVTNHENKYIVKKNRLMVLNQTVKKEETKTVEAQTTNKQFKITRINGNKLKLIKVN